MLGLMEDLVDQANLVSAINPSVLLEQQDLHQAGLDIGLFLGPLEASVSALLVHQEARSVELETLAQSADFHMAASVG